MKSILGAVGLALALVACNTDALPPAAGFATVAGTVIDGATNSPVAGAVVTIDTVLTATTDAQGKFSVASVPSGIVDYTVTAQGYKVVVSSANADPGKPYELDVTLAAQNAH